MMNAGSVLRGIGGLWVVVCFAGCLPQTSAPVVEGPVDTNVASQLQSRIRAANGDKFSVPHEVNGKEFTANWELGNAFKKSSQLQIKPPADWSEGDLFVALDTVLTAHETKPWYGQIDETVLRLMREALADSDHRARDLAPDTPYDTTVTVKAAHHRMVP